MSLSPSSLLFLHLSDLHFGLNRFPNEDLERIGQVLGMSIHEKSQTLKVPLSLVFVTGDIANTAKPSEYKLALTFFNGFFIMPALSLIVLGMWSILIN